MSLIWLSDLPPADALRILKLYQGKDLYIFKVSTLVNYPANDSPDILEPKK